MTYPQQPYTQPPAPARTHRTRNLVFIAIHFLGGFLIGLGVGGAGGSTTGTATPAATATVTTVETLTATVAPAATKTATAKPSPKPAATFDDGSDPEASITAVVGDDIPAGTWSVKGAPSDCYWEVDKHGTDNIIRNNDSGGHQTVQLRKGEDFTSGDCGVWRKS